MINITVYDNDVALTEKNYDDKLNGNLDWSNNNLKLFRNFLNEKKALDLSIENEKFQFMRDNIHTVLYLKSLPKFGNYIYKNMKYIKNNGDEILVVVYINTIKGHVLHHDFEAIDNNNIAFDKNDENFGNLELYWNEKSYLYANNELFYYNNNKPFYSDSDIIDHIDDKKSFGMILFDLNGPTHSFDYNWLYYIPDENITLQILGGVFLVGKNKENLKK